MGERKFICFIIDGVFKLGDLLFRLRDETTDGGMDDYRVKRDGLELFQRLREFLMLFAEACLEAVFLVEMLLLLNGLFDGKEQSVGGILE